MDITFENSRISCSTFASLSSVDNGGSISISNASAPLEIVNCIFINSTSSLEGGAIYLFNSATNLTFDCFYGCASCLKTNGKFGNAMLLKQSESTFCESSCYLCAKDHDKCTDSCVTSSGEKFISFSCNATNNYGVLGSGMMGFRDTKPGSFSRFNKAYKCYDYFFMEFVRNNIVVSYCDFIEASGQAFTFCLVDTVVTFENCVFIDNFYKDSYNSGTCQVQYINCTSNENKQSWKSTSVIREEIKRNFAYDKRVCNQVLCSNFLMVGQVYHDKLLRSLSFHIIVNNY